MAFMEEVSARAAQLTPAEAAVARYLAEHPHRVGHLSAARIAVEVGASDATVIRTVRRLGYDGLASLREALATELSLQGRLENTLSRSRGKRSAVRQLIDQRVDVVATLPARLHDEALDQAVKALAAAERVCLVGFGPAGHVAEYAAHQFRRTGRSAFAATATGRDLADELTLLRPGDAIILLAYDDLTREVDVLLDHAGGLGVPVVQLAEDSLVADRRPAVVLPVGRGDPTMSATHAATVAVLESLVLAVAARRRRQADVAGRQLEEMRRRITPSAPRRRRR